MRPDDHQFVGAWRFEDPDSTTVYLIEREGRRFRVRAFDPSDGEEYIISNIRLRKHRLAFDAFVPSTQWRVRYEVQHLSPRRIGAAYTVWEKWKRIEDAKLRRWNLCDPPDAEVARSSTPGRRISARQANSPGSPFIGAWQTEEEDSWIVLFIRQSGSRLRVRAFSLWGRKDQVVRDVRLREGRLRFETSDPASHERNRLVLTPMPDGMLELELTFFERWKPVPKAQFRSWNGGTAPTAAPAPAAY